MERDSKVVERVSKEASNIVKKILDIDEVLVREGEKRR